MRAAAPVLPPIEEGHLRLLRIFRAVAESGGLTAAETRLRMERSTISRHLQALERQLGGTLCYRGPTGFELTELGRVTLRIAVTAGDTLDLVRAELDRARKALGGELHLGIADNCLTNPACRVHRAIAAFRDQAPAATLRLVIGTTHQLQQDVLQRRLHLAVTGQAPAGGSLHQVELFGEDFRLYVGLPEGGPAPAVEALAALGYGLVTRENDHRAAALARRFGLDRQAMARGLEAVALLIASGGYVGYLPTHLVEALGQRHQMVEVRGAEPLSYGIRFVLTSLPQQGLSPAGDLLASLVRQAHAP